MMGPAETEVMVSPPPTGSATSQNSLVGSVSQLPAGWVGFIMMGPAETEVMVSPPPTGSATSQNSLVGSVSL